MLSLTLPRAEPDWLEGFARGFGELARAHEVMLVGGDTTAGPLAVSVQIMGHVPRGTALRRDGGRDGRCARGDRHDRRCGCRARPRDGYARRGRCGGGERAAPPLRVSGAAGRVRHGGARPRERGDGSVRRTRGRSCRSSLLRAVSPRASTSIGCPCRVHCRSVAGAQRARDFALGGGDDYELLMAVPPARFDALAARAAALNLTLTAIGELRRGNSVQWELDGRSYVPAVQGYSHFR